MFRLLHFSSALLLFSMVIGCGGSGGSTDEPVAPKSTVTDSETPPADPVPFESIPLSKDSSYESAAAADGMTAGEIREFTALKIKFCWCPAGTFQMGTPDDEKGHLINEVLHDVTFTKGFWIQQTEVTQAQYEKLMGVNPSHFKGPENPVDSLTWPEAVELCRRLSALPPEKKAGNVFRLPTESEWEYACRAGAKTQFYFGAGEEMFPEYGWFMKNSERTTHPVGQKKPNAWNIHDIHGNVFEWCSDFYGEYPREAVTDPTGPASGDKRTLRGGNWFYPPMHSRASHREAYPESARYVGLGMRLVLTNGPAEAATPTAAPAAPATP